MLHAMGKFMLIKTSIFPFSQYLFIYSCDHSVVSVFCSEGAPVQEGSKLAEVTP